MCVIGVKPSVPSAMSHHPQVKQLHSAIWTGFWRLQVHYEVEEEEEEEEEGEEEEDEQEEEKDEEEAEEENEEVKVYG